MYVGYTYAACTHAHTQGGTEGGTDGWMDGWMDGWTDGWMHVCMCIYICIYVCKPGFGLRQPAGHNPKLLEPTPGLLCVSIPKTLMNLRHTRNSPVPNTFKTRR